MAGHGRDELLALALAEGQSHAQAALTSGLSVRSIHRRLRSRKFRRRVSDLRGQMVSRAVGKMAESMVLGADTVKDLLKAKSETVRLGAARILLEVGSKLHSDADFEERMRRMEEDLDRLKRE